MSIINIGPKIKELRKSKGISQEELASRLGYSGKSVISHIEKGDWDMTYDKIVLLIREFMLDANMLFDNAFTWNMNLQQSPFSMIKSKEKTIEMRLNDIKRKALRTGDLIEFKNTETEEILTVKIVDIKQYKDFKELYKNYNKIELGYKENETSNPDDMLQYYSKEDIDKWCVLAIKITTDF